MIRSSGRLGATSPRVQRPPPSVHQRTTSQSLEGIDCNILLHAEWLFVPCSWQTAASTLRAGPCSLNSQVVVTRLRHVGRSRFNRVSTQYVHSNWCFVRLFSFFNKGRLLISSTVSVSTITMTQRLKKHLRHGLACIFIFLASYCVGSCILIV